MENVLFALWFFLPVGLANLAPIFAARLIVLRNYSAPIDLGRSFRGIRIFGDHKTWRGLLFGTFVGLLVFLVQKNLSINNELFSMISANIDYATLPWAMGGLMGFGGLAADAIKSFFKRRAGKNDGESWFPIDQLDYIGGGLLVSLFFIRLSVIEYFYIIAIWFSLHLLSSFIGYKLGLKAKPI